MVGTKRQTIASADMTTLFVLSWPCLRRYTGAATAIMKYASRNPNAASVPASPKVVSGSVKICITLTMPSTSTV